MNFELVIAIISLVLSAGVTAYISLRKLPTETKRAEVDIQAIFLEVNTKVQQSYSEIIDELRDHITELDQRLDKQRGEFTLQLSSQETIIEDLKIRLLDTEKRLREAEASNKKLAARVDALEKENDRLKIENAQLRGEST
jgi:chromosome segregation ATPase